MITCNLFWTPRLSKMEINLNQNMNKTQMDLDYPKRTEKRLSHISLFSITAQRPLGPTRCTPLAPPWYHLDHLSPPGTTSQSSAENLYNFPLQTSIFVVVWLETRVSVLNQSDNPINDNKSYNNDRVDHFRKEVNNLKRKRLFDFNYWI